MWHKSNRYRLLPNRQKWHSLNRNAWHYETEITGTNRTEVTIISGMIKNCAPDKDIIKKLVEHYNQQDNSDWLLERFNNLFVSGSALSGEYKNLLQAESVVIPEKLKKYFA